MRESANVIRHFFQAIDESFVGFREGHLLGLTDEAKVALGRKVVGTLVFGVLDGRFVGFLDGLAVTKRLGLVLGV